MRASIWAKMPLSAQYRVLSRSKIQFFTCRKSGRKSAPEFPCESAPGRLFSTMFTLSIGAEHGLGGAYAQAPLTDMHHACLKPVKAPRGRMGAGNGPESRDMDQISSAGRAGAKSGLNPRDALDILDIRTGKPGGATELACSTDAGADVLHYLATRGAPATRAAVVGHPAAPPFT